MPGSSTLTPSILPTRSRLRGLYIITSEMLGGGHLAMAVAALNGGARIIQLRDKSTPARNLLPVAHELRQLTLAADALLIVNDQLDLALLCAADGVHLGPDDWPIAAARKVLGPDKLIGASCGSVAEAATAVAEGANYIGAGAVFDTSTKTDAGAPIGTAVLRAMVSGTSVPVAAIGGIGAANIAETVAAGAQMACVVSAVANAGSIAAMTGVTRRLVQAMQDAERCWSAGRELDSCS